jgi:hypothetical protein
MTQARDDVGDLIIRGAKAAHRIATFLKKLPDDISPQKQIEELSQLIDTFTDVDQRFRELPDTYPGHFKQARIDHLLELIDGFAKNAEELRSSLLEEVQPSKPKQSAGPSRQSAPHPKAKVKKTRPRQQTSTEAAPTEDAPIGAITLDARARPATVQSDKDIIVESFKLSGDAPAFISRMTKDASRPTRVPADMQDIFDQQASKLEQNANSVDQVWARTKAFPVASLAQELRTAAVNMREAGKSVRASLYKLRKPTQSTLRWMHENAQIKLQRDKGRTQTKKQGDYFQEYRILDSKNNDQELWLAHFHYQTLKSPMDAPTTAHLKISETYLKTLTEEQRNTLLTVEPIDGVFRKIDDPDLRKLFFDLEPVRE